MELGLQFQDILCYEATAAITAAREESMETAIPEYCPDMARIVDAVGRICIREKLAGEERSTVSGSVKVSVLYTSEEAVGLKSLTMSVPFTCTLEDPSLARCKTLCANGRVLLVEARAVTSRKLYLRVMPEITVVGYRQIQRRVCCGVDEDPAVRVRRRSLTLPLLREVSEKDISVAQEVLLDEEETMPEELLLYRLTPTIVSQQRLGNKMMLKGEMQLFVLYCGEGRQLHRYETALPFSQVCDVAELPEDGECVVCPRLGESDVRLLRTENGCGFGVTARLEVCFFSYGACCVDSVSDLYSLRCATVLERQAMVFPTATPHRIVQEETQIRFELQGQRPFLAVTDVDCAPVSVQAEEGRNMLRTTLHLRVMYLDDTGAPVSTERSVEVSAATGQVSGAVTAECGQITTQMVGDACQVTVRLLFLVGSGEEQTESVVCAVRCSDAPQGRCPSLILRRMGQEETLWDIAKQYRTDEEAIRSANHLEADERADCMLLIPRVR